MKDNVEGIYLRISRSELEAMEWDIDAPKGACECGDPGYALVYDYKTNAIDCLCKHHLSIAKLQLAMRGFTFIEWPSSPGSLESLAGVRIQSLVALTDAFEKDILQINGMSYGYLESESYSDVPLEKLRGARIERVRYRMRDVYSLQIRNCRLAVHSCPT